MGHKVRIVRVGWVGGFVQVLLPVESRRTIVTIVVVGGIITIVRLGVVG